MKRRMLAMIMAATLVLQSISTIPVIAQDSGISLASTNTSVESAMELILDTDMNIQLEKDASVYYKFVPQTSGLYCFYSKGSSVDTVGLLLDAEENILYENDDYDGVNFRIEYLLEAGETYYLQLHELDYERISSCTIKAEKFDNGLWAIAKQEDVDVAPNESVTLEILSYSSGTLSYQWYYADEEGEYVPIEGATSATYEVQFGENMKTSYHCSVSDETESKDINFWLNIDTGLKVSGQSDVNVPFGGKETLSVDVTGGVGTICYQWYYNDWKTEDGFVAIEGATSSSYEVEGTAELKSEYFCEVRDDYQQAGYNFYTTLDTGLTVTPIDKDITVPYGEKVTLSVTASGGVGDISYQWYAWDTEYYEYVAIEGATSGSYEVTGNSDMYEKYKCVVTDDVVTKECYFYMTVDTGLTVIQDDEYVQVPYQEKKTLSVTASGGVGDISYQWYAWDTEYCEYVAIEGATSGSYEVTGNADMYEEYKCVVTDDVVTKECYFMTTLDTGLQIEQSSSTIYIESGKTMDLSVTASGGMGDITYQWYYYDESEGSTYYIKIEGATTDTYQITGNADTESSYTCIISDGVVQQEVNFDVVVLKIVDYELGKAVEFDTATWDRKEKITYKITPEADGWYQFVSDGDNDPYMRLLDEQYNKIISVDDTNDTRNFDLNYLLEAGKTYYAVLDWFETDGTFTYTVQKSEFGAIPKNPDIIIERGGNETLEVIASSTNGILTYQWSLRNGTTGEVVAIEGANESTYVITGNDRTAYEYICRVSNGTATCDVSFLVEMVEKKGDISGEDFTAKLKYTEVSYDGIAKTPEVSLISNKDVLLEDEIDYTVSYKDNIDAGTATVIITGKGYYKGSITLTFEIQGIAIDNAEVSLSQRNYTYDGKAKTPDATVTLGDKTLVAGTDYSVSYSNNTKVGTATVTITGKGGYTGTIEKTFVIAEAPKTDTGSTGTDTGSTGTSGVKDTTGTNVTGTSQLQKGKTYVVGSYKYKITGKDTVAFAGIAKKSVKKVIIAKTVKIEGETFKITSIANKALYNQKKVTSVTIGANVTKIGKEAFSGCKKLKSITIKSKKLKSVGKNAFKGINKKAKIKVPAKNLKAYKQMLKGKGQPKSVKIKK